MISPRMVVTLAAVGVIVSAAGIALPQPLAGSSEAAVDARTGVLPSREATHSAVGHARSSLALHIPGALSCAGLAVELDNPVEPIIACSMGSTYAIYRVAEDGLLQLVREHDYEFVFSGEDPAAPNEVAGGTSRVKGLSADGGRLCLALEVLSSRPGFGTLRRDALDALGAPLPDWSSVIRVYSTFESSILELSCGQVSETGIALAGSVFDLDTFVVPVDLPFPTDWALTRLPTVGSAGSAGEGIDRYGRVVVGSSPTAHPSTQASVWRRVGATWELTLLDDPVGVYSRASAVMPSGSTEVIGGSLWEPEIGVDRAGYWTDLDGEFQPVPDHNGEVVRGPARYLLSDRTLVIEGSTAAGDDVFLAHPDSSETVTLAERFNQFSQSPLEFAITRVHQVAFSNGYIHTVVRARTPSGDEAAVYLRVPALDNLPPTEVAFVGFVDTIHADDTIVWDPGPAGATYDVLSGPVSDFGPAAVECLATNQTDNRLVDSRPAPNTGEGYYFLISAENAGTSTGFGEGVGRDLLGCPRQ